MYIYPFVSCSFIMDTFDLTSALFDNVSVVEIFVLPHRHVSNDDGAIRVGWNDSKQLMYPALYCANMSWNIAQRAQLKVYHYRDMSYSYDLSSDGQRCIRQTHIKDQFVDDRFFVVSMQEDVLPCHRFPCTQEIVNETIITRTIYRINNRICLHHDVHEADKISYLYFRYQHSDNVDVSKMSQDLMNAMRRLIRRSQ